MWRRAYSATRRKVFFICALLARWGIFGDVRSAVVGSIFGAIVGLMAVALADEPPKHRWVFTNESGYAQPIRSLLDPLEKEGSDITMSFEPTELEQIFVCEYAHLSGFSDREILFAYLDRYSMCLWVVQRSPSEFAVRPNLNAGFLTKRDGNWFCKCGS